MITPREQQVVDLLLQGCSNKEIGDKLGIKGRTAKAYLNRLYLRYGIYDGIKRVKLAIILYREAKESLCPPTSTTVDHVNSKKEKLY